MVRAQSHGKRKFDSPERSGFSREVFPRQATAMPLGQCAAERSSRSVQNRSPVSCAVVCYFASTRKIPRIAI